MSREVAYFECLSVRTIIHKSSYAPWQRSTWELSAHMWNALRNGIIIQYRKYLVSKVDIEVTWKECGDNI